MATEAQPNPPNHPLDYLAFVLLALSAAAEFTDMMPAKYAGITMALYAMAKLYTKWLGTQQQKDALSEGTQVGGELKADLNVAKAKKADPV